MALWQLRLFFRRAAWNWCLLDIPLSWEKTKFPTWMREYSTEWHTLHGEKPNHWSFVILSFSLLYPISCQLFAYFWLCPSSLDSIKEVFWWFGPSPNIYLLMAVRQSGFFFFFFCQLLLWIFYSFSLTSVIFIMLLKFNKKIWGMGKELFPQGSQSWLFYSANPGTGDEKEHF